MLAALLLALVIPAQTPEPTPKPPPSTMPVEGPKVAIETSMGRIVVVLYQEDSPLAVKNFLQYVEDKHYDGTIFHRVMHHFMIQGGGYDSAFNERPTREPIRNEARNGLRNSRGTLAMARGGKPNSARAQFFVNLRDNHVLDFGIGGAGYTVFGRVIEGMDVVDAISAVRVSGRGPHEAVPDTAVMIDSVRVVEP